MCDVILIDPFVLNDWLTWNRLMLSTLVGSWRMSSFPLQSQLWGTVGCNLELSARVMVRAGIGSRDVGILWRNNCETLSDLVPESHPRTRSQMSLDVLRRLGCTRVRGFDLCTNWGWVSERYCKVWSKFELKQASVFSSSYISKKFQAKIYSKNLIL